MTENDTLWDGTYQYGTCWYGPYTYVSTALPPPPPPPKPPPICDSHSHLGSILSYSQIPNSGPPAKFHEENNILFIH